MLKKKGAADELAGLILTFIEGAFKGVGIFAIICIILLVLVLIFFVSW